MDERGIDERLRNSVIDDLALVELESSTNSPGMNDHSAVVRASFADEEVELLRVPCKVLLNYREMQAYVLQMYGALVRLAFEDQGERLQPLWTSKLASDLMSSHAAMAKK